MFGSICASKKRQKGGDLDQGNTFSKCLCKTQPFPWKHSLIGYLAPVAHSPASTGAEVALLSRVWPLNGCAVSLHPGATLHAPPVGPQPAGGGALQQEGSKKVNGKTLFMCTHHPDPRVKGFLSPEAKVVLDVGYPHNLNVLLSGLKCIALMYRCSWGSPSCI